MFERENKGVASASQPPGQRPFGVEPVPGSSKAATPNALRTPDDIWNAACVGRQGYCSSDLQDAARDAIADAQVEALMFAASLAHSIRLPEGYQWSDSNFRKFEIGCERMAEAILEHASAAATGTAKTPQAVEGEASQSGDAEGSATPNPVIRHD